MIPRSKTTGHADIYNLVSNGGVGHILSSINDIQNPKDPGQKTLKDTSPEMEDVERRRGAKRRMGLSPSDCRRVL